jgi:hypothetical protein
MQPARVFCALISLISLVEEITDFSVSEAEADRQKILKP